MFLALRDCQLKNHEAAAVIVKRFVVISRLFVSMTKVISCQL
jgi:hypothetical protein